MSAWQALLANRKLQLLALLAAIFHLANAAMLTSVGQQLTHIVGKDSATSLVAVCIVAAQCVMVPVAILVGRKADVFGRKPIFLFAFAVLAIRGVLYTFSDSPYYLVAVQLLDGIGAGVYGALMPVIVADLTRGSGRFNVSQGASPPPRDWARRSVPPSPGSSRPLRLRGGLHHPGGHRRGGLRALSAVDAGDPRRARRRGRGAVERFGGGRLK